MRAPSYPLTGFEFLKKKNPKPVKGYYRNEMLFRKLESVSGKICNINKK